MDLEGLWTTIERYKEQVTYKIDEDTVSIILPKFFTELKSKAEPHMVVDCATRLTPEVLGPLLCKAPATIRSYARGDNPGSDVQVDIQIIYHTLHGQPSLIMSLYTEVLDMVVSVGASKRMVSRLLQKHGIKETTAYAYVGSYKLPAPNRTKDLALDLYTLKASLLPLMAFAAPLVEEEGVA